MIACAGLYRVIRILNGLCQLPSISPAKSGRASPPFPVSTTVRGILNGYSDVTAEISRKRARIKSRSVSRQAADARIGSASLFMVAAPSVFIAFGTACVTAVRAQDMLRSIATAEGASRYRLHGTVTPRSAFGRWRMDTVLTSPSIASITMETMSRGIAAGRQAKSRQRIEKSTLVAASSRTTKLPSSAQPIYQRADLKSPWPAHWAYRAPQSSVSRAEKLGPRCLNGNAMAAAAERLALSNAARKALA